MFCNFPETRTVSEDIKTGYQTVNRKIVFNPFLLNVSIYFSDFQHALISLQNTGKHRINGNIGLKCVNSLNPQVGIL